MSLENLSSITFSDAELHQLNQGILAIKEVIVGKAIELTTDQRDQYTHIANQNMCIIDTAKNHMEQHPDLVPTFLDKEEFDRDYTTCLQIKENIDILKQLTQQLTDTKILLDYDNYTNALSFYQAIRYRAGKDEPDVKKVYDEMNLLFTKKE
ncbi:hypothetical protein D1816_21585 [Aquimarina sp. AD10]|uniref:hypothetical protein n=1 Tax=Aquimarina TaxID=290174 RepID=UPI000E4C6F70|nr:MULTISPECIES: hypothetical protein [Aquimarina]AXT62823.1 hypothetical protein D1816_21585 [Aquimarina sp. AD10]RKN02007.1 hypothetical protein D7033_02950 [Aquimarina sp. AD10]